MQCAGFPEFTWSFEETSNFPEERGGTELGTYRKIYKEAKQSKMSQYSEYSVQHTGGLGFVPLPTNTIMPLPPSKFLTDLARVFLPVPTPPSTSFAYAQ